MLSDDIAKKIVGIIDESKDNSAIIGRNDLAKEMGCAPSQINYVISTRFTPEHGYVVKSRRGGGGFIRITRVSLGKMGKLMHIVNSLGDSIDELSVRVLLDNCVHNGTISKEAAKIISSAVSASVMRQIMPSERDKIRATIVKETLISLI